MRDNGGVNQPRVTEKKAGRARGTGASASPAPREPVFRSGFACFVGRPNVGKSTLMNALVGAKVAITSSRPQTTRRLIRGVVHRPDAQLVIMDTPGLHKPRTLLGERLDSLARSALTEVDVIGFCVSASQPVGTGDAYLARELAGVRDVPVVAILTMTDRASRQEIAQQLVAVEGLGDWADIVPVSAVTGFGLDVLADVLIDKLHPGRPLYPDGELTDEPEQIMVAELIREAALEGVRDELPHSIAVVVEEMGPHPGRDDLTDVYAELYVERPSQKAIVIGTRGARLKDVGSRARRQIEALLGTRVYLDLHVKEAKDCQPTPKQLGRLGFYDWPRRGVTQTRFLRPNPLRPVIRPGMMVPTCGQKGSTVLIIFGLRVFYRTIAQGTFHCRRCGGDRQYRHRVGRRWFTLFFLPVIPLNSVGEHVQCTTCRTRYVTDVLSQPTTAQMQAALPAGMRAAVSAMLRSGDPASAVSRQRAIEAVIGAGTPRYDEAMLNADLMQPFESIRPALNQVGAQLTIQAREWYLAEVIRIAMADGSVTDTERHAAMALGLRLGMT